jgi:hypothetical protein
MYWCLGIKPPEEQEEGSIMNPDETDYYSRDYNEELYHGTISGTSLYSSIHYHRRPNSNNKKKQTNN